MSNSVDGHLGGDGQWFTDKNIGGMIKSLENRDEKAYQEGEIGKKTLARDEAAIGRVQDEIRTDKAEDPDGKLTAAQRHDIRHQLEGDSHRTYDQRHDQTERTGHLEHSIENDGLTGRQAANDQKRLDGIEAEIKHDEHSKDGFTMADRAKVSEQEDRLRHTIDRQDDKDHGCPPPPHPITGPIHVGGRTLEA